MNRRRFLSVCGAMPFLAVPLVVDGKPKTITVEGRTWTPEQVAREVIDAINREMANGDRILIS